MARFGYGHRIKRSPKAPELSHARPRLRDRVAGFARRIKLARKSKTLEKREMLFIEMADAIREDRTALKKSLQDVLAHESHRIQGSASVDAMFGFLKGAKRGVIPKTEKTIALEKKIKAFSDRLAFELEKANISPTAEQERRAYSLIDLLMHKGDPRLETVTAQGLLKQKREIDQSITDFIKEQSGKE